MVLGTLGALDPGTLVLLDIRTLGPLPSSNTSSYFLLPLTSTYLFLLLLPTSSFCLFLPPPVFSYSLLLLPSSFYFLLHPFTSIYILLLLPTSLPSPFISWFGMGGGVSDDYGPFGLLTWEIEIGNEPWTFIY